MVKKLLFVDDEFLRDEELTGASGDLALFTEKNVELSQATKEDLCQSYMHVFASACRLQHLDVLVATNTVEAMTVLRLVSDIDLVILDIYFEYDDPFSPSGIAFARKLSTTHPDLPVILLTNDNSIEIEHLAGAIPNIDCILRKTAAPNCLAKAVCDSLGIDFCPVDMPDVVSNWSEIIHWRRIQVIQDFYTDKSHFTEVEKLHLRLARDEFNKFLSVFPSRPKRKLSGDDLTSRDLLERTSEMRDKQKKGKLLEQLLCHLFQQIDGFNIHQNVRTKTQEIDIAIENRSKEWPWATQKPTLLCECKNWSQRAGKNEYVAFANKIATRYGHCNCGFFVSWNGFAKTFCEEKRRESKGNILIVPITGDDIRRAVTNNNFDRVLVELYHKAVLD